METPKFYWLDNFADSLNDEIKEMEQEIIKLKAKIEICQTHKTRLERVIKDLKEKEPK